jgi:hypothetical protein
MSSAIVREIQARSILSASKIYPYVIDPYVGCQHACSYCYARYMKRFTGHTEPYNTGYLSGVFDQIVTGVMFLIMIFCIIKNFAGKDCVDNLAVNDGIRVDFKKVPIQDNHVGGLASLNAAELVLFSHRVGSAPGHNANGIF